jgi:hypothetical protein
MKPYMEVFVVIFLISLMMLGAEGVILGTTDDMATLPLYLIVGFVVGITHFIWSRWLPWNSQG